MQKVQTNGGGRVLVVPRPSHVPRPSGSAAKTAAALKATRGGGVHKGGAAPKFMGAGGGGGGGNRNVKVTIGNKLRWVGWVLAGWRVLRRGCVVCAGHAGGEGCSNW